MRFKNPSKINQEVFLTPELSKDLHKFPYAKTKVPETVSLRRQLSISISKFLLPYFTVAYRQTGVSRHVLLYTGNDKIIILLSFCVLKEFYSLSTAGLLFPSLRSSRKREDKNKVERKFFTEMTR